jgi:hypothetical protein
MRGERHRKEKGGRLMCGLPKSLRDESVEGLVFYNMRYEKARIVQPHFGLGMFVSFVFETFNSTGIVTITKYDKATAEIEKPKFQ